MNQIWIILIGSFLFILKQLQSIAINCNELQADVGSIWWCWRHCSDISDNSLISIGCWIQSLTMMLVTNLSPALKLLHFLSQYLYLIHILYMIWTYTDGIIPYIMLRKDVTELGSNIKLKPEKSDNRSMYDKS